MKGSSSDGERPEIAANFDQTSPRNHPTELEFARTRPPYLDYWEWTTSKPILGMLPSAPWAQSKYVYFRTFNEFIYENNRPIFGSRDQYRKEKVHRRIICA